MLRGGLEHLKIETRSIDERFASVMVECVIETRTVVYYATMKRELNKRLIYECRCDERLKAKAEGSTCHSYTGCTVFLYYESIK